MICGYCNDEIEGLKYTYIWFPDDQIMKPVHMHHLEAKKKGATDGQE